MVFAFVVAVVGGGAAVVVVVVAVVVVVVVVVVVAVVVVVVAASRRCFGEVSSMSLSPSELLLMYFIFKRMWVAVVTVVVVAFLQPSSISQLPCLGKVWS